MRFTGCPCTLSPAAEGVTETVMAGAGHAAALATVLVDA